jgi:hypothetical protein
MRQDCGPSRIEDGNRLPSGDVTAPFSGNQSAAQTFGNGFRSLQ